MFMDNTKNYKHIIWDWNGTLLDDVDIVIDAMNKLLQNRNLPLLDKERYMNIFTFPVKDYYASLGFDFSAEPFEKLAVEYITEYNSYKYQFRLLPGVVEVLEFINYMGINQSILSASQERELVHAVCKLNIIHYFVKIAGLNNIYATSKVDRGKDLLKELGLKSSEVLLIGDTIHDYEVAEEIGCDCLLVCNGHQSFERISCCKALVVETISDAINIIRGEAIA